LVVVGFLLPLLVPLFLTGLVTVAVVAALVSTARQWFGGS
jgi:hypothetical protein